VRQIAIVGSGPAGYYTAEAALKEWGDDVEIDIFDMLPVPYGLIRTGVAPDHQSIRPLRGATRQRTSSTMCASSAMLWSGAILLFPNCSNFMMP
jgi:protoporphyrinogen oxidase